MESLELDRRRARASRKRPDTLLRHVDGLADRSLGALRGDAVPEEIAAFAGTFPLWPGTLVEFRVEGDGLVSRATGKDPHPMRRLSRDRFHVEAYGAEFRFRRDDSGRVVALTYRGLDADRLPAISPETLAALQGTYRSAELGTEYDIVLRDGAPFAEHVRHEPIELVAAASDRFLGEHWFFREAEFDRDPETGRSRMRVSCSRLENVSFLRLESRATPKLDLDRIRGATGS